MKKLYSLSALVLLTGASYAQAFWTEDFGTGCNRGQLATAYSGPNGAWTIASPGANGNVANTWYISATSANTGAGNCADNCNFNAVTNATLHVSNVAIVIPAFITVGADTGASYFSGGFSSFGYTANTSRRAESPMINCTGQTNISISFIYLENGDAANDDASLVFSADGGTTWSVIDALAKTNTCSGTGEWTSFTATLPASADNNANVKIGFMWVNNDDGAGADPSFSVDDIALTPGSNGIAANAAASFTMFADNNEIVINANGAQYNVLGITDMLGRNVSFTRNANRLQLDNVQPGAYVVSVEVNGERVTKKVVIQ